MAEKQDSRSNLLNGNIFRTMLSLSVPAILGMVVIGLYSFIRRLPTYDRHGASVPA